MENERFFGNPNSLNWQSSDANPTPELNSGQPADQLSPPCFLNLNWDRSIDHNAQFESALSSLVSSPTSNPPAAESVVIRELIGRLGSICNSGGELSPPCHYQSTTTSCYSTPMNSPPKLNLSMMDPHQLQQGRSPIPGSHLAPFSADPGFAERAARFSCFGGGRSYGQFGLPEAGKLSRVSSSQSLKAGGSQMGASENGGEIPMQEGVQLEMDMRSRFGSRVPGSITPDDDQEFGNAREESSASDPVAANGEAGLRIAVEGNARKRKAAPKGKGKEAPLSSCDVNPPKVLDDEDMNLKRCRSLETDGTKKDVGIKPKAEQNGGDTDKNQGKENNVKLPEPPKDYIHVRARRGQATDSHSLAERVRREKISERMKFLQDLVPGCNKVTGKAVMLDEIINYVQSLQRQVEFLSMKLATVNPRLEFNIENIIPNEMNQAHGSMTQHSIYPLDAASTAFSYAHQTQGTPLQSAVTNGLETQYSMNSLDSSLRRSLSMQLAPGDGFGDATSQLGTYWEDDLQSFVHMGFGQNQETAFSSQSFHGLLPTAHMKIEL